MFPIINALPIIIFISVTDIREKFTERFNLIVYSKRFKIWFTIYIVINFIILLGRSTYPAAHRIIVAKYLWQEIHKHDPKQLHVISYDSAKVFHYRLLSLSFYKPRKAYEKVIFDNEPRQKRKEQILSFIKELKEKNIDDFFIHYEHTKFYSGEVPFPEDFLFMKDQCPF